SRPSLARLSLLGGQITMIEGEGDLRTVITGTIPKKRISGFKAWILRFSGGQATFEEYHPSN
ncbi:MAG: hypothetical protein ABSE48_22880, partial [Verrucomicrobiota bacterium]